MADKLIDDLSALATPASIIASDKVAVGRSDVLYQFNAPAGLTVFGGPLTIPTLAVFSTTFDDTAGASANTLVKTDTADGVLLSKSNTSTSNQERWGVILKAVPGGTNWSQTLGIKRLSPFRNRLSCGLILRESATGKWLVAQLNNAATGNGFAISRYSADGETLTGAAHEIDAVDRSYTLFARFRRVSASSKYFIDVSFDLGRTFTTIYDNTITTLFTTDADQIGFGVDGNTQSSIIPAEAVAIHYS